MAHLFIALLVLIFALPASAEEKAVPPMTETVKKLDMRTEAMLKNLDSNQMKQFQLIRGTHGTIRAVEHTQNIIGEAIASCGKENPEMKDELDQRYTAWRQGIMPTMEASKKRLQEMVLSQSFAKAKAVYSYLKLYDQVSTEQDIKTYPIKDEGECKSLLRNMDRKQDDIIRLMTKIVGFEKPLLKKQPE